MSANSSSCNTSLSHSSFSSSVTFYHFMLNCFNTETGALNVTVFAITIFLFLLPLCILVLCLGIQRWRQQRSGTAVSHSDLFANHMAISDLMNVIGFSLSSCGVYAKFPQMVTVGVTLFSVNMSAVMFFHLLTCVEHYLAVVHPVTYLSLRTAKGIRIRNITIGCVWLTCFAGASGMFVADSLSLSICYCFVLLLALAVIFFCSLSVLCVLIRPGPGDGGGDRHRVDKSKLRAFYTIMIILGVLLFRFGGNILTIALYVLTKKAHQCELWFVVAWFSLPSNLVSHLLFLQRAGKLACCQTRLEETHMRRVPEATRVSHPNMHQTPAQTDRCSALNDAV